jgi:hypothetical protein
MTRTVARSTGGPPGSRSVRQTAPVPPAAARATRPETLPASGTIPRVASRSVANTRNGTGAPSVTK